MVDTTYNGWKNYSTWNVAMFIANDEYLFREAVRFAKFRKDTGKSLTYSGFIRAARLEHDKTPDGIKWISTMLDYKRLNEMMQELAD